jgi:hypothetical protein
MGLSIRLGVHFTGTLAPGLAYSSVVRRPPDPGEAYLLHDRPRLFRRAKSDTRAVPHRRHAQPHGHLNAVSEPVLALLTFLLLASLAAGSPNQPVAAPGDRLVFGAAAWPPSELSVPARRLAGPFAAPAGSCRLDLGTMSRRPGALTVLAVRPDGVMLDWAGGATAQGQAGCAVTGGLLVSTGDYLAMARAGQPKR